MKAKRNLPVYSGKTWEQHVQSWQAVAQEIDDRQWTLSAIADSVARKYGEGSIERFARAVDCKAATVWQYAQVYQQFKNSERSENLSWSHHLVASYAADPERALEAATGEGLSVQGLRHHLKDEERRHLLQDEKQVALFESLGRFRSILFKAIIIDPPWEYDDQGSRIGASLHYETMSLDQMASLPVGELAAEDCHLYLWVTNSFIRQAYQLLDAWGFEEKTVITWVKRISSGRVNFGFGHYFRNATEHIIFATRGSLPTLCTNQANVIFAPRGRRSEKPQAVYRLVERMSPAPYLELFARGKRRGWHSWGNEIEM